MDFAINFRNWYQDEVQAAYWTGTQTTIHATINFFRCLRPNCNQIVNLSLVHLSDDMKHDSFLACAAQNLTFKYLTDCEILQDLILQFCDNCASQYKSRWPFSKLACSPFNIIRTYFGEKDGKSHADALFGRLKAWMSFHIKARHVIIKNAHDFYNYCRDNFQTPKIDDACQHYRVEFQYIRPSDVRHHQDCDLDRFVPHTQEYYSVRNTAQPLSLKFRKVPCLCSPCISEKGECLNKEHIDPWQLVKLVPKKGDSKLKHEKQKCPTVMQIQQENVEEPSDDEELPEVLIPESMITVQSKNNVKNCENVTDTVTDTVTDMEIMCICQRSSEFPIVI